MFMWFFLPVLPIILCVMKAWRILDMSYSLHFQQKDWFWSIVDLFFTYHHVYTHGATSGINSQENAQLCNHRGGHDCTYIREHTNTARKGASFKLKETLLQAIALLRDCPWIHHGERQFYSKRHLLRAVMSVASYKTSITSFWLADWISHVIQ